MRVRASVRRYAARWYLWRFASTTRFAPLLSASPSTIEHGAKSRNAGRSVGLRVIGNRIGVAKVLTRAGQCRYIVYMTFPTTSATDFLAARDEWVSLGRPADHPYAIHTAESIVELGECQHDHEIIEVKA